MRLLSTIISAFLVGSALTVPTRGRPIQRPQSFIGPLTKEQRIAEGWIDDASKYFHEQDGSTNELRHYDRRFYRRLLPVKEREVVLKNLVRSYLTFFASEGIETWIAHGTLLGWFWNGKILPWDLDIDTQMSGESLAFIGTRWNMTRHFYEIPAEDAAKLRSENPQPGDPEVVREYLLDVNSHISQRIRGDGMNVIDARWIDVHNGLYIDITGLSETDPASDPNFLRCKNNHRYSTSDLYPMRDSMFEDVPARIPYAYDKILIAEYQQKSLIVTEFEGHIWNPEDRLWIKKSEFKKNSMKNNAKAA